VVTGVGWFLLKYLKEPPVPVLSNTSESETPRFRFFEGNGRIAGFGSLKEKTTKKSKNRWFPIFSKTLQNQKASCKDR